MFIDCTLLSFSNKLVMCMLFNRDLAGEEIKELLADFRNKRALGLGSLFGDHQLEGTCTLCNNILCFDLFT